jgi:hypothetical protein
MSTQAQAIWVSVQTFSRRELTMDASTTTNYLSNRKVKIKHPQADTLSISTGAGAYAGMYTSEIAFFSRGQWVLDPIEPFADYHDGSPSDASTAVYPYVPNELIEAFIVENACK